MCDTRKTKQFHGHHPLPPPPLPYPLIIGRRKKGHADEYQRVINRFWNQKALLNKLTVKKDMAINPRKMACTIPFVKSC